MLQSFTDWVDDIGTSYRNLRILKTCKTHVNHVILAESHTLGKILIINNEVQHVEKWKFLYHEPLVHLPMSFIKNPSNAIIIGGGSLNALRELNKYKSLKEIEIVEIDYNVIRMMTEIDRCQAALISDSRVNIKEADGYAYLARSSKTYDLIINDALDITKLPRKTRIVQTMQEHLTNEGVCVDVVYRHIFEKKALRRMFYHLSDVKNVVFSLIYVPDYPGILHLLTMWARNPQLSQTLRRPINVEQKQWIKHKSIPCEYFDPSNLSFFLHIPQYMRKIIKEEFRRIDP